MLKEMLFLNIDIHTSALSANNIIFFFLGPLLILALPPDKIKQGALARDTDGIFSAQILICYQF